MTSPTPAPAEAHTPGPWSWDMGDGSLPELRQETWDGETDPTVLCVFVCKACIKNGSPCMMPNKANAALIAAAPAMYEALKAAHHALDVLLAERITSEMGFRPTKHMAWPAVEMAHAALASARPTGSV